MKVQAFGGIDKAPQSDSAGPRRDESFFGFVRVSLFNNKLRMYSVGLRDASEGLTRPLKVIVQTLGGIEEASQSDSAGPRRD